MNVFLGAFGSGLGFLGSLFLLVDVWPVIRDPEKEANREFIAEMPGMEVVKMAGIKDAIRKRSRYYRLAVILLAAGFLVQTVSVFF